MPLGGISNKAHDHGRGYTTLVCIIDLKKKKVRKEGGGIGRDTVFSTESSGVVYHFDSFQLSMTTMESEWNEEKRTKDANGHTPEHIHIFLLKVALFYIFTFRFQGETRLQPENSAAM